MIRTFTTDDCTNETFVDLFVQERLEDAGATADAIRARAALVAQTGQELFTVVRDGSDGQTRVVELNLDALGPLEGASPADLQEILAAYGLTGADGKPLHFVVHGWNGPTATPTSTGSERSPPPRPRPRSRPSTKSRRSTPGTTEPRVGFPDPMTGRRSVRTLASMSYPPEPYGDQGPAYPGPEPIFPHAEAQAALTAIQALLDQLMALDNTRSSAATTMLVTSSGQSIDAFKAGNENLSTELAASWGQRGAALQMDAQWVRDAITNAQTIHDQWKTQLDRHHTWVKDHPGQNADTGPR